MRSRQFFQAAKTLLGLLERDAPHQPMNLIAQIQQVFGKIASVLPRDSRNERFFFIDPFPSATSSAAVDGCLCERPFGCP